MSRNSVYYLIIYNDRNLILLQEIETKMDILILLKFLFSFLLMSRFYSFLLISW